MENYRNVENIQLAEELRAHEGSGTTALALAAAHADAVITKMILDAGADVNTRDGGGCTPLFCASVYASASFSRRHHSALGYRRPPSTLLERMTDPIRRGVDVVTVGGKSATKKVIAESEAVNPLTGEVVSSAWFVTATSDGIGTEADPTNFLAVIDLTSTAHEKTGRKRRVFSENSALSHITNVSFTGTPPELQQDEAVRRA